MYEKNENSTVHGLETPYGLQVPHKIPGNVPGSRDMLSLVGQLYPTGRAWYLPENGVFLKTHEAINLSLIRAIEDTYSLINSIFPDNDEFSEDDADFWEYNYGLITINDLDIESRKTRIRNKMAYPQNIIARQNWRFIQFQLQDNGFDVEVHENIFFNDDGSYYYKSISDLELDSDFSTRHGDETLHGAVQHGSNNYDVIANSINEENFGIGGDENLWATFFISGIGGITTPATILQSRYQEFRELVIKLKPSNMVVYLIS